MGSLPPCTRLLSSPALSMVISAWTALAVLVAVAAGVSGIRRWAEQRRIVDVPNERSSHTTPTPRGGGLMIVAGTLAGLAFTLSRGAEWPVRQITAFFAAAILVAAVSWLDDLRSLSNRVRIVAHFSAAAIVMFGTGRLLELPGPELPSLVSALVTLIWIAGLTNAYNFMDGIDGIAATQGVIAGLAWIVLAAGSPTTATLALLLAVSSFGFLLHNWPPARIFMGDVGSAFLGFAFAAIPLMPGGRGDLVTAALVVWPFVFDTAFTFLRRLRRREAVFSAHRSHLYQRLVIAGMSHRSVTLLYGALAAIGCALAWWSSRRGGWSEAVALAAISLLALALWIVVVRKESRASGCRDKGQGARG
jgi:UDP-N-acetylmuramyl pentapeptide phosphotransferase/UDP-N-acetylglucosamine-1-phosphate transferase